MPEPEITEEFQARKVFSERLYKELQTVEKFRFKFQVSKITFVTGLIGIGAIGAINPKVMSEYHLDLRPALYLAPLVAVLFDILGMGATVAIYRIDAFLREEGLPHEKKWQDFQDFIKNRWPRIAYFSLSGATGFTLITFLASVIVLSAGSHWIFPDLLSCLKVMWFAIIVFLYIFFRCWECKIKHDLGKESISGEWSKWSGADPGKEAN